MIKVTGLSKSFGEQVVLDRISFEVADGEILAILGPSGTGKSVLLLQLVGLMSPDAGDIEINGAHVNRMSERELLVFRRLVGYLFQDSALYDFMTVGENLAFPLREHTNLRPADVRAKVSEYLQYVDMPGSEEKYPSQLSGGMRKRAALARAMILGTKVLLCDEPTSGLDPVRSRDISVLIRGLSKKLGCTTVITTHDVKNAFRLADRSLVLNDGAIAAQGSEADLRGSRNDFVREFLQG